nr:immunoglobulin light chain junction region [Macaca mulatta]
CLQSSDWPYSF